MTINFDGSAITEFIARQRWFENTDHSGEPIQIGEKKMTKHCGSNSNTQETSQEEKLSEFGRITKKTITKEITG